MGVDWDAPDSVFLTCLEDLLITQLASSIVLLVPLLHCNGPKLKRRIQGNWFVSKSAELFHGNGGTAVNKGRIIIINP